MLTLTHAHTHTYSCGQHGVYATTLPTPVVVNSAKLFATLSRKMVNFVDGDELKLETQILQNSVKAGPATTQHTAWNELGPAIIKRLKRPPKKWALAQRKLYKIILHKFLGQNLLLALLVCCHAPDLMLPLLLLRRLLQH